MNLNELVTYIEELSFRRTMFGYDMDEVDVQLDKINDEIMALVKKKDDEIAALKSGAVIVEQAGSGDKKDEPDEDTDAADAAPAGLSEEDAAELEQLRIRNQELEKQVLQLQDRIAALEEELDQATERAEIAEERADETGKKAEALAERIRDMETEIEGLMADQVQEEDDETVVETGLDVETERAVKVDLAEEDDVSEDQGDPEETESDDELEAEGQDEDEDTEDDDYDEEDEEEDDEDDGPAVLLVDEDTEEAEEPERVVPGNADEAYNQYMRNADLLCRQLSLIDDQKEGILQEARTEAEGIVSQAKEQADTMLEEARVQADVIVGEANDEAEGIRRDVEAKKQVILEEAYQERDERLANLERDRALYEELVEKKAAVIDNLRKLSEEAGQLAGIYENPDYESLSIGSADADKTADETPHKVEASPYEQAAAELAEGARD